MPSTRKLVQATGPGKENDPEILRNSQSLATPPYKSEGIAVGPVASTSVGLVGADVGAYIVQKAKSN